MKQNFTIEIANLSPRTQISWVISNTQSLFRLLYPESLDQDAVDEIAVGHMSEEMPALDFAEQSVEKINKAPAACEEVRILRRTFFHAECARRFHKEGEQSKTQSHLAMAFYWMGVAHTMLNIPVAEERGFAEGKRAAARAAANARADDRYKGLLSTFIEVEKKLRPPNGWTYRRQAAAAILSHNDFRNHPNLRYLSHSDEQKVKRLAEWTKKIPDAANAFPEITNRERSTGQTTLRKN